MISLVALSGIGTLGCWRSVALPPTSAIPNTPANGPPSVVRVPPRVQRRLTPGPLRLDRQEQFPSLSQNPWKPNAQPRQWNSIVIHHTATSRGSVESIHETHLNRKDSNGNAWLGIGYHFVIGNGNGMPDGTIEPTFRWRQQLQGAHAGVDEYNRHGIGVALVGNFDEYPPTSAQLAAVKQLVGSLKAEYGIESDQVIGHAEIKATACPGKYFPMAEVGQSFPQTWIGQNLSEAGPVRLVGLERSRKQ